MPRFALMVAGGNRWRAAAVALTATLALLVPGTAGAKVTQAKSQNWSGYASTSRTVRFKKAVGTWTVPVVSCAPGVATYSSNWIGIGGYFGDATTLAQLGTESDCSKDGTIAYTAWTEFVPVPSEPLDIAIRPGDKVQATVTMAGRVAHMEMYNLTTGVSRSVDRTVTTSPDLSSVEWILEAPAVCDGPRSCKVLPLAQFGPSKFSGSSLTTSGNVKGTISNKRYSTVAMTMESYIVDADGRRKQTATPSPLNPTYTTFSITHGSTPAFRPLALAEVHPFAVAGGAHPRFLFSRTAKTARRPSARR